MSVGTVKWFDEAKRFGFIVTDDDSELYVHASGLAPGVSALGAGDRVEFETREDDRGEHAVSVSVVERAALKSVSFGEDAGSAARRQDLAEAIDDAARQLASIASIWRERGSIGTTAAFKTANTLRRLANRLNPPPT